MKTPQERAREIVTKFRGKFVNWENAVPMMNEIAAELERQEKYIAALEAECEAASEYIENVGMYAEATMEQHDLYYNTRAARLALKDGGKNET